MIRCDDFCFFWNALDKQEILGNFREFWETYCIARGAIWQI